MLNIFVQTKLWCWKTFLIHFRFFNIDIIQWAQLSMVHMPLKWHHIDTCNKNCKKIDILTSTLVHLSSSALIFYFYDGPNVGDGLPKAWYNYVAKLNILKMHSPSQWIHFINEGIFVFGEWIDFCKGYLKTTHKGPFISTRHIGSYIPSMASEGSCLINLPKIFLFHYIPNGHSPSIQSPKTLWFIFFSMVVGRKQNKTSQQHYLKKVRMSFCPKITFWYKWIFEQFFLQIVILYAYNYLDRWHFLVYIFE